MKGYRVTKGNKPKIQEFEVDSWNPHTVHYFLPVKQEESFQCTAWVWFRDKEEALRYVRNQLVDTMMTAEDVFKDAKIQIAHLDHELEKERGEDA